MSNIKFTKNCNLWPSISYSQAGQFSQEVRLKGRNEQHKIQISTKQLVLLTFQKKEVIRPNFHCKCG